MYGGEATIGNNNTSDSGNRTKHKTKKKKIVPPLKLCVPLMNSVYLYVRLCLRASKYKYAWYY